MKYFFLFASLLFSLLVKAQYVSAYKPDGTPKSSAAIKAEEARNAANKVGANGSTSTGGTSHAYRKEVRNVKADIKKEHAANRKRLKSYSALGPLIIYPGQGVGIRGVQKDGKWGFIDMSGELIYDNIPLTYDDYRVGPSLLLAVKKGMFWGFINEDERIILPFEYDNVLKGFDDPSFTHKGTALVMKDGKQFEIDSSGTDITAKTQTVTDRIIVTDKTGDAHWMTVNLNVNCFRNGDMIPEVTTEAEWDKAGAAGTPCWCFNDNNAVNGVKFGRLYNWYAVNDKRGLAPAGFHVATGKEWMDIIALHGGIVERSTYYALQAEKGWPYEGSNSFGFSALPGGARFSMFWEPTRFACWWAANEMDAKNAVNFDLRYGYGVERNSYDKAYGMSVRCVKD